MLIFFFKINVNLPQLLYFVVLAALLANIGDLEGFAFGVYLYSDVLLSGLDLASFLKPDSFSTSQQKLILDK